MWITNAITTKLMPFVAQEERVQLKKNIEKLLSSKHFKDYPLQLSTIFYLINYIQQLYPETKVNEIKPLPVDIITKDLLGIIILAAKVDEEGSVWNIDFKSCFVDEELNNYLCFEDTQLNLLSDSKVKQLAMNHKALTTILDKLKKELDKLIKKPRIQKLLVSSNVNYEKAPFTKETQTTPSFFSIESLNNMFQSLFRHIKFGVQSHTTTETVEQLDKLLIPKLLPTLYKEIYKTCNEKEECFYSEKAKYELGTNTNEPDNDSYLHRLPYRIVMKYIAMNSPEELLKKVKTHLHTEILYRIEKRVLDELNFKTQFKTQHALDFLLFVITYSKDEETVAKCEMIKDFLPYLKRLTSFKMDQKLSATLDLDAVFNLIQYLDNELHEKRPSMKLVQYKLATNCLIRETKPSLKFFEKKHLPTYKESVTSEQANPAILAI
jgi:hypothetical protein